MMTKMTRVAVLCGVSLWLLFPAAQAQLGRCGGRPPMRNSNRYFLRGRQVEGERIETEMRTASGIVDGGGSLSPAWFCSPPATRRMGNTPTTSSCRRRSGWAESASARRLRLWMDPGRSWRYAERALPCGSDREAGWDHRGASDRELQPRRGLHIWPPDDKAMIQISPVCYPLRAGQRAIERENELVNRAAPPRWEPLSGIAAMVAPSAPARSFSEHFLDLLWTRVPHPFRVFCGMGGIPNQVPVYTISETLYLRKCSGRDLTLAAAATNLHLLGDTARSKIHLYWLPCRSHSALLPSS